MTFGDALGIYGSRLEAKVELKPSAKLYRQKCIEALSQVLARPARIGRSQSLGARVYELGGAVRREILGLGLQQHRRHVAPCSGYFDC